MMKYPDDLKWKKDLNMVNSKLWLIFIQKGRNKF